ncbi:hypothetical protein KFE94_12115 [bacterium SCSIO 12643]|nr:hypothetical protein KFE94_12115 [bacterium SCSIO 12643]
MDKFNKVFNTSKSESIDLPIDWENVEIVSVSGFTQTDRELKEQKPKFSVNKQMDYGFFTYINGFETWRNTAYSNQNEKLVSLINEGIIDWITWAIEEMETKPLDIIEEVRICISGLLNQLVPESLPSSSYIYWEKHLQWYFEILIHNGINVIAYQNLFDEWLLRSIDLAIRNKKFAVVERFTRRVIDGIGLVQLDSYGLGNLIIENSEIEKRYFDLSSKVQYIYSIHEYEKLANEIDLLVNKISELEITNAKEIGEGYKSVLRKNFQRLNLEKLALHFGARLLFEKEFTTLKNVLNYNQPYGNHSFQGNRDVFPKTVPEILEHGLNYEIEGQHFYQFWPGHMDSKYWVYQLLYILLARSFLLPTIGRNNFTDAIRDPDQLYLLKDLKKYSFQNEDLLSEKIYPGFKDFKFEFFDGQFDLLISNSEKVQK